MDWHHVAALLLIAFACNLPLGMWRSMERRLSLRWFVAVHLSVPVVIFLRLFWQLPNWLIPLAIGTSVLAQLIGGTVPPRLLPLLKKKTY